jgi:hypothetical protein
VLREALEAVEDSASSLYRDISLQEQSCTQSQSQVTVKSSAAEMPVIEETEIKARIDSAFLKFKNILKSRDEVISRRMGGPVLPASIQNRGARWSEAVGSPKC